MFGNTLKQHFMVMGADVDVTVGGDRFEVDVQNTGRSEVFQIRLPDDGSVTAKVLDSDWRRRHLVLRNTETVPKDPVAEREAELREALFHMNFVD